MGSNYSIDNIMRQYLLHAVQSTSSTEYDDFVESLATVHFRPSLQHLSKQPLTTIHIFSSGSNIWRRLALYFCLSEPRDKEITIYICMLLDECFIFFHRYDYTNYARWVVIYLAEMHRLPDEVLSEFQNGNWVVKDSAGTFNQVDPDHSQEWLNGTVKRGGGIVGIAKRDPALSR